MVSTDLYLPSGGHATEQIAATLHVPNTPGFVPNNALALHGHAENRQVYERLGTSIAGQLGMHSLALDLRGHGESSGMPDDYSFDDHVADIITGLEHLHNIQPDSRTLLIARSYTAPLAIRAMSVKPETVAGLVLITPAIYPDTWEHGYKTKLDTRTIDGFRLGLNEDTECQTLSQLSNSHIPVLILAAEHDKYIPDSVIRAYCTHAKYSFTELIYGAAHDLSAENYFKINQKILAWIQYRFMRGFAVAKSTTLTRSLLSTHSQY